MDGEGDVLQHEEDVCHRDGEQDQVDGVGAHLPVAQHEDVQQVEEDTEHTDHDGEVTVQPLPRILTIQIQMVYATIFIICNIRCILNLKFIKLHSV